MKISLNRPRFTDANMISAFLICFKLCCDMLIRYKVKLRASSLTWICIFFHGIRSDAHNKCSEIDTLSVIVWVRGGLDGNGRNVINLRLCYTLYMQDKSIDLFKWETQNKNVLQNTEWLLVCVYQFYQEVIIIKIKWRRAFHFWSIYFAGISKSWYFNLVIFNINKLFVKFPAKITILCYKWSLWCIITHTVI